MSIIIKHRVSSGSSLHIHHLSCLASWRPCMVRLVSYVSVKMSPAPVSPAPVWSLVTSAMAEPWPPRTPCLINTNNSGIGTVTRQDALIMLHVKFPIYYYFSILCESTQAIYTRVLTLDHPNVCQYPPLCQDFWTLTASGQIL